MRISLLNRDSGSAESTNCTGTLRETAQRRGGSVSTGREGAIRSSMAISSIRSVFDAGPPEFLFTALKLWAVVGFLILIIGLTRGQITRRRASADSCDETTYTTSEGLTERDYGDKDDHSAK